MKKVYILLLVMLPFVVKAQLYNPYVANASIVPAPMPFAQHNGTALFSFDFGNSGTAALPYIVGQEMVLSVSLLRGVPNTAMPNFGITGSMQFYFTWTYDAFGNTMIGTQNQPIPANTSGLLTVDYKVTSNSTILAPTNGCNVNIAPSPAVVGINNVGDDNTSDFSYTVAIGLAVRLENFSGQKFGTYNKLNWTTSSEENSSHFNLYYGTQNNKMSKLAEVPSQALDGESNTELNYSYDHTTPVVGDNYYRLSSMDRDGKEDFHNAINIYIKDRSSLRISPNPAKDRINISYQNGELDMVEFTLSDMQGRIVYRKRIVFENGTYSEWIPLHAVGTGTYLLNITDFEGYNYSQKVIKQ